MQSPWTEKYKFILHLIRCIVFASEMTPLDPTTGFPYVLHWGQNQSQVRAISLFIHPLNVFTYTVQQTILLRRRGWSIRCRPMRVMSCLGVQSN